jgi:hypothetical protein
MAGRTTVANNHRPYFADLDWASELIAAGRSIHELWRTQPGLPAGAPTDEQDLLWRCRFR